jgi:pentatricopeptide repeat protein
MVAEVTFMITIVMDNLPKVWLELSLAIIAVIVYVSIKPPTAKEDSGTATSCEASANPEGAHEIAEPMDQELTASQQALKAMRQGKTAEAIKLVHRSPECIRRVPFDVACRFLISVAKTPKLSCMTDELKVFTGKISSQALEAAIIHIMKAKDVAACRQLHTLSGVLSIAKSPQAFEALARAYMSDAIALRVLVEEAGTPLASEFAAVALESCAHLKESGLAAEILEKTSTSDVDHLRGVVKQATAAAAEGRCDEIAPDPGVEGSAPFDTFTDAKPQRVASAFNTNEIAMRANDIRSCGKNGDLKGAIKVFERLGSQANNTLILNSLLDACVECKDMPKAVEYFNQPELHAVTDVVSFNTMMKGYIASGQEQEAKRLLEELAQNGLGATRTSFHGLLNARVNAGDFNAAWKLVTEMQANDISPNAVTCSILMKGKMTSTSDLSRVLALIDTMEQPMDDVLFPAVVEACIRTGRLDLLSRQTEKFMKQGGSASVSAPTYGSMIKAYGQARDVKRVWHLWDQMFFHSVQPTSVTLGCMVEALVGNGRTDEAWQLVQKMWSQENTRPLVNTVIYSSILKGFSHTKETDRVLALYEEMRAHDIQANTITYNTILNAFAQGGAMHCVPALLEDMKAATPPAEPDIVTYSTIIKGFCNSGSLDRALKVLEDMKDIGKHSPDEVMYNSLLGGCAKEHRPDEALQLLNDMKKYNVAPSNYTLSMLVKLMGRCRRINQAFTMLEDISKEYGLKINIQVYTCLIQGCFNAGQAGKALALHEKIFKEGLIPDAMTYTVLVRGCVQSGLLDKAAELARSAYGRAPGQNKGSAPGLNAGCLDEVITALGETSEDAKELLAELGNCQPVSTGNGGGKGGKSSGKGKHNRNQPSRQGQWAY